MNPTKRRRDSGGVDNLTVGRPLEDPVAAANESKKKKKMALKYNS